MLKLHNHFAVNNSGHLAMDGYDLLELADAYSTPVFVISESRMREKYRQLRGAFKNCYEKIFMTYAVKANLISAVVRVFAQEGSGADVLPGGELDIALSAGISHDKLILEGNNKSESEIKSGLEAEVGLIVVDSMSELMRIDRVAARLGKKPGILIRVNPVMDVPTQPNIATAVRDSKFGIAIPGGAALMAFETALKMKNLDVAGIHVHIGSGILSMAPFLKSAEEILDLAALLKDKFNFIPKFLDFGGGFGIPYKPGDPALSAETIANSYFGYLKPRLKEFDDPAVIFEPGRYLIGDSEILLGRIGTIKESPVGRFAAIDASTNLLFPYFEDRYFEIIVVNKAGLKPEGFTHFCGPLCFSGDVIRRNCKVPDIEEGDVVAILNVGAYCQAAASTFNAYPRPPTLLIGAGGVDVIQRRETLEDIKNRDIMPERLQKDI